MNTELAGNLRRLGLRLLLTSPLWLGEFLMLFGLDTIFCGAALLIHRRHDRRVSVGGTVQPTDQFFVLPH